MVVVVSRAKKATTDISSSKGGSRNLLKRLSDFDQGIGANDKRRSVRGSLVSFEFACTDAINLLYSLPVVYISASAVYHMCTMNFSSP